MGCGGINPLKYMLKVSRQTAVHIGFLLVVLGIFLGTAIGVFKMGADPTGGISLAKESMPAAVASWEFLVLVCVGLLMSLLLPLLSPVQASILTLLGMLPVWYVGFTVTKPSPPLPMEYSLLTILMLFVVNVLVSYFTETHAKQKLISAFGQYVPPELVRLLNEDPDSLTMEGEARQMTVMFCDVKNFTSIAEQLEPKQLVSMLNALFNPLTAIMHKHRGTIDKYMGDAVMAFWGAPLQDPMHAQNAVRAALEIQEALTDLRIEFSARDWPEISMGIGLSTGEVNVGNMGSEFRVAYTVVGDTVNLAARLESMTRNLHVGIIVSEPTQAASQDIVFRELAKVKVKGKQEVIRAFEPVCRIDGMTPELKSKLELHNRALDSFYRRRWDEAVTLFGQLWQLDPRDRLYEIFLQNIAQFTKGPTPDSWSGELETHHRSKFERRGQA